MTEAPALVTLRAQLDAMWPTRSRISDGLMATAAHAANDAAHGRRDDHALGNALDITSSQVVPMDALALALLADPRTVYVIWKRRIQSRVIQPGAWRAYTGEDPHTSHLHVSIEAEKRADASAWTLPEEQKAEKVSRSGSFVVLVGVAVAGAAWLWARRLGL